MNWRLGVVVVMLAASASAQQHPTRVFLNGVATPVNFNDGDSFRILAGPHSGAQSRLGGYNSLESFGPVHQWGTWTRKELAHYSKLATTNGRQGVWRCTSDLTKDGYGRLLWWCKDLAIDQVRKGFAHAMTVSDAPADADVLAAQAEAIAAKRGMWAHGVPDYVLTSNHSAAEGYPQPYNRMVSTKDGSSRKWEHHQTYEECSATCQPTDDGDPEKVRAFAHALKVADSAGVYARLDETALEALITELLSQGAITSHLPPGVDRATFEKPLTEAVATGALTKSGKVMSCMLYVDFTRRYGASRAACLR